MNQDPLPQFGSTDPDEVERLLARNPLRGPPPAWRDAILAHAAAGSPRRDELRESLASDLPPEGRGSRVPVPSLPDPPRTRSTRPSKWWDWLSSGWTVAAAAWVLVFTLNEYASPKTPPAGPPRPPFSEAALAEIRTQHRQMMAASNPRSPLT